MGEAGRGALAMAGACAIWGLSPIYFKALAHVPASEVVAHRVIWSVVFLGAVLAVQGRLRAVAGAARGRALGLVAVASAAMAGNWLAFVVAIQTGRALEASLGYYVFPLVAVGLGYTVLGERFSRGQAAAVALAAAAVVLLTAGLGAPPWLALWIAGTFGLYGLVKARTALGPVASVFVEAALLLPLAAGWLLWLAAGRLEGTTGVLLVMSGPLTGLPLILFSYAARRLGYATLGLIQYLNPTLQFFLAVALFGEPFTRWHAIAFPMIWAALALYSVGAWRRERRAARSAIRLSTQG